MMSLHSTKLKFHVEHKWMGGIFNIQLASYNENKVAIATNVTFKEIQEGEYIDDCLMPLKLQEAQDLMDELYAAGIRPSQAAGSAGQLEAVKYHLEDMRTLVLKNAKGAV